MSDESQLSVGLDSDSARSETDPDPAGGAEVEGPLTHDAAVILARMSRELYLQTHSPERLPMYLQALLTTLVTSLEVLVGHLFETHIRTFPQSVSDATRVSLADLASYASISELIDAKVEEEVDRFRRCSLTDWNSWFQSRLKIKFEAVAKDLATLNEVIQRRNVFVHNDGRVSAQYRQSVGAASPAPGTRLPIDADYLRRALDEVLVFGSLLAYTTWRRIDPANEFIDDYVDDLGMQLMVGGRWEAVEALCERSLQLKEHANDSHRTVLAVNRWLAIKRRGGLAGIRSEIEAWDVSALSSAFRMAKAALLDDLDTLAPIVARMVAGDDLPMFYLHTWPILEEFRAGPAYARLITARETTTPEPLPSIEGEAKEKGRRRRAGPSKGSKQDTQARLN